VPLWHDLGIARGHEHERDALRGERVGDREAQFRAEHDIEADEIDALAAQLVEGTVDRRRRADHDGACLGQHVLDQFCKELRVFDHEDSQTVHLQFALPFPQSPKNQPQDVICAKAVRPLATVLLPHSR
jgi:hypothetical protein